MVDELRKPKLPTAEERAREAAQTKAAKAALGKVQR